MARQSNEGPALPEGARKGVPTRGESLGGGKGSPVNQETKQLALFSETAENLSAQASRVDRATDSHRGGSVATAAPKSENKDRNATSATRMEDVVARLRAAFQKVASNRGAPGPDGRSISEVREHLEELLPQLSKSLLEGTYRPGAIGRVWIAKSERRSTRAGDPGRDRQDGSGGSAPGPRAGLRVNVP